MSFISVICTYGVKVMVSNAACALGTVKAEVAPYCTCHIFFTTHSSESS